LLRLANQNGKTLTEPFGDTLLRYWVNDVAAAAMTQSLKAANLRLLASVMPEAAATIARLNLITSTGTLLGLGAIPLLGATILDQLVNKGACVQLILDKDDDSVKVDSQLIFNPMHFADLSGTVSHVFKKKSKRFSPDSFQRQPINLRCDTLGEVQADQGSPPPALMRRGTGAETRG
jgi:hypothetical protein